MKKINSRYIAVYFVVAFVLLNTNRVFASSCSGPTRLTINSGNIAPSQQLTGQLLNFYKSNKYDLLNLESAPSFESAFKLDGTGTTQIGGQAVDSSGNIYVAGGFTDTLYFNTPQGLKTLASSGYYDVFLAKYDSSGNCLWVRNAQGYNNAADSLSIDGALAIAVDKAGNVYIGGGFVKTLSFFDSQKNVVASLSSADTSLYNFELFVAKYNTDGNLLWAEGGMSGSHGSAANLKSGINGVTSIVLDAQDLPYIGGRFAGANFLGTNVGLEEDGDFFLAALDPTNGQVVWGTILGTPGEDGVLSLAMDVYGYINALGFMGKGSIAFPTTPETILTNNDTTDTFIAKFDVNGNCLWADLIGGAETIRGVDVAADTLGNIYVAGLFAGTATFAGSNISLTATGNLADGYLAKYDFNGNCLWARRFGGASYAQSNSIAVDGAGNSFDFGIYDSSATFGSENPSNEITLTSNTGVDMFVAAYDSAGNYLWTKKLDCTGYGGVSQITNLFSPGKQAKVSISNNPLSTTYSDLDGGRLILAGDFNKQLSLDGTILTAPNNVRDSFIASLNVSNNTTAVSNTKQAPLNYSLLQNYPNPFNPSTVISYQIPKQSNVELEIYDILGDKITTLVNKVEPAGNHNVKFNAANLASGIYLYRLQAGNFTQTKKLMLIK